MDLMAEIQANPTLCDKDHWRGGSSFSYDDDVAANAPPGLARLASRYYVAAGDESLRWRTAELISVTAFLSGAAQRPGKAVKVDFIFIHMINASLFFSVFLEQEWLSEAAKRRLLSAFARIVLLFYASSLAPPLLEAEIVLYQSRGVQQPASPAAAISSTWQAVIQRCLAIPDDGHLVKLVRALAHGERVCRPWEQEESEGGKGISQWDEDAGDVAVSHGTVFPMQGNMWLQVANMAVDSAEAEKDIVKRWVRGAGSDEAWDVVPDRGLPFVSVNR